MGKPLEGIRVIDLSHVIAGPLASFYLAQLGAEVIKVEAPGGEVLRGQGNVMDEDTPAGFTALNAGKASLCIDIRSAEGARTLRGLARTADVFIENFKPGVVARYGFDFESVRVENPSVIYCSISGFGQTGEWSERGAYDHVVQAMTGMMMLNGDGEAPVKVGFPVIDVASGVLAAMSIVASIRRRDREGRGQLIDASMVQGSLALMYPLVAAFLSSAKKPQRMGNRGYSGSPAAGTYKCKDGWVALGANTPPQFRKLTAALGIADLCESPRALNLEKFNAPNGGFVEAKDLAYVQARFDEACARRSAAELETELNRVGIPAARVRELGEFLQETGDGSKCTLPQFAFQQDWGVVRTAGLGFAMRDEAEPTRSGAPALGADNERLAAEASSERIHPTPRADEARCPFAQLFGDAN